jgi:hypothetical protein
MLDLAKDNLTAEEIENNLLIAEYLERSTVCILAANLGKRNILLKVWD